MVGKPGITVEKGTKVYRMVRNRNLKVLGTAIAIFLLGFYLLYTGYLAPATYTAVYDGYSEQIPINKQDISGVIIFDIPFILLGCYGFFLFFTRTMDMSRHPDVKRFNAFGDPQGTLDQFEREISGSETIKLKNGCYTQNFLVHESFYRFRWAGFGEVTWTYEQRTRHLVYFIPIFNSYKVIVHVNKQYAIHIECKNEKEAISVLKKLKESAPHAIFGYSPEIKKAWYTNNKEVVNIVTARAQEAEKNQSQFEGQIDALFEALERNNVTRSIVIIDAMGQKCNRQAVEPLSMLLEDPNESIRLHSAEALGSIGDMAAIDALTRALGDHSGNVRFNAVVALGIIGDKKALPALEKMIVSPGDARLYTARLKAIEQINIKCM